MKQWERLLSRNNYGYISSMLKIIRWQNMRLMEINSYTHYTSFPCIHMQSGSLVPIQSQLRESWLRADLEKSQFITSIQPSIHPSVHPTNLSKSLTDSISHHASTKGTQHCEESPCLQILKKHEGLKTTQEFQA